MSQVRDKLLSSRCKPVPKGSTALFPDERAWMLTGLLNWELNEDGTRIRRSLQTKNFVAALDLFRKIGDVAEAEDHHPDLHLVGYNNVTIELWTHTVGGLSENDFIVAAKIDRLLA